ncbi:EAL domain-containing protein [Methylocaldum sp.]|uniref:EAL domain-containing protein n=1 Tax=Methylocaldum sp. TaxID=1969727 RepID=UPI002D4168AB|nr:EAL domain-containing protein [Methylocaldum sp.]HYE37852.1 EAL domain-containing protein [Methylocaldum sp.]
MAKILIVDDRPLNREFLVTLLGYGDHRLLEASDGAEALEIIRAEHPDLVITDILMPAIDGYELVNQLRADPALAKTRVIFYTATYRAPEARALAESCGVSAVLAKPSSPEEILGVVQGVLGLPATAPGRLPDTAAQLGTEPLGNLAGQLTGYFSDIETVRQLIARIIESGPAMMEERDQLRDITTRLSLSLNHLQEISLRLATLIELGLELASVRDPKRLLETFCRAAHDVCAAQYAVVGLLNGDGKHLCQIYTRGMEEQTIALPDLPSLSTGILARLLAERHPQRISGLNGDPESLGLPATHPPIYSFLGLPIASSSRVYGWVYLANKLGAVGFDEIDEDIAATVTAQVATAYENLGFYDELQRRAVALQLEITERKQAQESLRKTLRARAVMAECNHALIHAAEEHELFDQMCQIMVKTGNYPMAWIGVVRDDEHHTLAPVAHAGCEVGCLKEWRLTKMDTDNCSTPVGRAVRSGRTVVVPDLAIVDEWAGWREQVLSRGYRSVIALPLKTGTHVFGALSIYDNAPAAFGHDELALMEELADDIAYGVENRRIQAARDRAERRLTTQYEVARLLAESATLSDASPKILQVICETLNWDVDVGELWVVDRAAQVLRCAGLWCREGTETEEFEAATRPMTFAPGVGLPGRIWMSQQSVWIADLSRDPNFLRAPLASNAGLRAAFGFPIRFEGRVLGAVGFFSREIRKPKEDLMNMFTAIGSQIGLFVERKRTEEELRVSEEKLSSILGSIDNIVWSLSPSTGETLYVNAAAEKVWGRPVADLIKNKDLWLQSVHPEDRERMRNTMGELLEKGALTTEYRIQRPDGEIRWLEDRVKVIYDKAGNPLRLDGVASDITERKQYEASIEYLATHDALTHLPNRTLLADRLSQSLAHAKRTERPLALLFLDLDRFKDINDSFGHALGDALLQAVAERLQLSVRKGDTVARQGGDEFLILLSDLDKMEDIEFVAIKILRAFAKPFVIEGRELFVSGSIGASVYPADGEDMETLLKHADTAMYRTKEEGGSGFRLYAREMSHRALERIKMESALRRALEQRQFELFYQPKVELKGGRIIGAEALIRWRHPDLGLVLPARFIPLAEETGLIHAIGSWVLKAACSQSKAWQEAGLPSFGVAVNLSTRQLRGGNLVELVTKTLSETGLEGRYLELELTETMVMQDPERFIPILAELKELGVRLSVDDFGTGYSSLSYLKRFPFDRLKIDQSFVRDIATDTNDAVIVQTVISLGHTLGLKVVAEGVETLEQLTFLCRHRCDDMQGYYSSRPVTAEQFGRLLRENRRLPLPSIAA